MSELRHAEAVRPPDRMAAWVASGGAIEAPTDAAANGTHGASGDDGVGASGPTSLQGGCRLDDGLRARRYTTYGDCVDDGLRAAAPTGLHPMCRGGL